jgi:hypothetical protein
MPKSEKSVLKIVIKGEYFDEIASKNVPNRLNSWTSF